MRMKTLSLTVASVIGAVAMAGVQPAMAQGMSASPQSNTHMSSNNKELDCHMKFTLKGWSAIYKTASGKGTVRCNNGETRKVKLNVKGGGLTAGKYKINNGHAEFTGVKSINDIMGSYASASAHAGATKGAHGAVMTKGNVTMSLGGTGNGWSLGVGLSGFTIKPVGASSQ